MSNLEAGENQQTLQYWAGSRESQFSKEGKQKDYANPE